MGATAEFTVKGLTEHQAESSSRISAVVLTTPRGAVVTKRFPQVLPAPWPEAAPRAGRCHANSNGICHSAAGTRGARCSTCCTCVNLLLTTTTDVLIITSTSQIRKLRQREVKEIA